MFMAGCHLLLQQSVPVDHGISPHVMLVLIVLPYLHVQFSVSWKGGISQCHLDCVFLLITYWLLMWKVIRWLHAVK